MQDFPIMPMAQEIETSSGSECECSGKIISLCPLPFFFRGKVLLS